MTEPPPEPMSWLEHKLPPPLLALLLAWLMWAVVRALPQALWPLPGLKALAAVLALIGAAIDIAGALAFRRARTTVNPLRPHRASALVVVGVYRVTRNPMYCGMALVLLGWALWLTAPLALAGPVAFVAYINRFQIAPEERALGARFGADYLAYCRRVRRWI